MKTKACFSILLLLICTVLITACTPADTMVTVFNEAIEDENIWSEDEIYSKIGYDKEQFLFQEFLAHGYIYNEYVEYAGHDFRFIMYYDDMVGLSNFRYEMDADDGYEATFTVLEDLFNHLDSTYKREEPIHEDYDYDLLETFSPTCPEEYIGNYATRYDQVSWLTENENIRVTLFIQPSYTTNSLTLDELKVGDPFVFAHIRVLFNYNTLKETDRIYTSFG